MQTTIRTDAGRPCETFACMLSGSLRWSCNEWVSVMAIRPEIFFLLPVCFFGFDVVLCIAKTQFSSRWRAFINYLASQSSKTDQNLNFPFPVQKSYISFFFLGITKNAMATWRQSFKSLVADGMAASELLGCQLLSLSTRLQPHWICTSQLLLKLWGTGYIFSWSQHGLSCSWNKWGWGSQGISGVLESGVSPANTASVVGRIVKLLFQNLFVKNIFVASLWHFRHVIFLRSLLAGELEVVQKRKTSSCVTAMHWSVSTTRKQWLPWSGEDSVAAIAATNGSLLHDLFHITSLSWWPPFAQGGTAGMFGSEKCIMEMTSFTTLSWYTLLWTPWTDPSAFQTLFRILEQSCT